ncbi:tRNA glutamyl-Q(34) synthetase GluQRS [Sphingobium sp. BYY-5]|uniref:tRNA glutamyl-Q(34) synthetase GluQRS n=1 Tax=Sphingobium sp. BYY-5 TaxID=2926400 RepID=UPI001FA719C2|nr:tRNA glutamyl-Q(34) synthetase GluQRS [Sphingobium sp. BYY-5]MCI4591456.1 tRNA glutamyl-Q(34) synthetase GluQRS [Sphingobium sp. BYY-5]
MTQSVAPQHIVTRFAPSPTGRLHIGHAWSALLAMDMARAAGGQFRLRIEDIDGTRSRPEHVAGIVEDLRWLGMEWDGEIVFQSQRLDRYDAALDRLRTQGLLYPCFCTRADIQASLTAPHGPEGPAYPGTCRGLSETERTRRIAAGEAHAWRIDMGAAVARVGELEWEALSQPHVKMMGQEMDPRLRGDDGVKGSVLQSAHPLSHGDVVLARKDAPASYHLSCTLDDAAMGVTHVLRGDDLRGATDIHRLLQALLDLPSPAYIHHPLLVGADGKRLAKRSGSIALADLRAQGIDPQRLTDALRARRFPVGIAIASA